MCNGSCFNPSWKITFLSSLEDEFPEYKIAPLRLICFLLRALVDLSSLWISFSILFMSWLLLNSSFFLIIEKSLLKSALLWFFFLKYHHHVKKIINWWERTLRKISRRGVGIGSLMLRLLSVYSYKLNIFLNYIPTIIFINSIF